MKFRFSLFVVVLASPLGAEEPANSSVAASAGAQRFLRSGAGVGTVHGVGGDLEAAVPYAYLVPGNIEGQYELSIDDLLTLVAELKEAAAQGLARGRTRVPIHTVCSLVQDKALEPVLRIAILSGGLPDVSIERPSLSAIESRAILAQVRARAKRIRAALEAGAVSLNE